MPTNDHKIFDARLMNAEWSHPLKTGNAMSLVFKRPFPIPLQLVFPQLLARPCLDDWHEELARHVAQALQCTIRTGGLPCIEMIYRSPVRNQQLQHVIDSGRNLHGTGELEGLRLEFSC